jgi:hypothetical protein
MPFLDVDLSRVWPKAGYYFPVGRTLKNCRNRTCQPMFGKDRRARKVYFAILRPDAFNDSDSFAAATTAAIDSNTRTNYPAEKTMIDQAFAELMRNATASIHLLQTKSMFAWFRLVGAMTSWSKNRLPINLVGILLAELVTARGTYKDRVSRQMTAAFLPAHLCVSVQSVDKFVQRLEEVMSGKYLRILLRAPGAQVKTKEIKKELFTKVWSCELADLLQNLRIATSSLECGLEEGLHTLTMEEDDGLDAEEIMDPEENEKMVKDFMDGCSLVVGPGGTVPIDEDGGATRTEGEGSDINMADA